MNIPVMNSLLLARFDNTDESLVIIFRDIQPEQCESLSLTEDFLGRHVNDDINILPLRRPVNSMHDLDVTPAFYFCPLYLPPA